MVLAAWATACRPQAAGQTAAPTATLPSAPASSSALPSTPDVALPTSATYPAPGRFTTIPPPSGVAPPPGALPYPAPTNVATPMPTLARFNGARALDHAAAQMQWVPRDTGSAGWATCGDYIAEQFAQAGWAVENQRFDYKGVRCRNIIAKRGSGPGLIIGAHYDARRRADRDPDPAKQNDPVPAANDGASGVAVLLELARVLKPEDLKHEIWLAAFDAEDNGELDGWEWIVGSQHMAENLTLKPQAVIVLDMIGDADQQIYYEQNSDEPMRAGLWQVADQLGYASFVPETRYSMLDDHTPFLQRSYRAIDVIDFDYPHWHTTNDTLDKISAASLEAVGKSLEEWLLRGAPGV